MHLNSQLIFSKYAVDYFQDGMKVLEIGPDGFPSTYRKLIDNSTLQWETIDILDDERLTHKAIDEYNFGLPDNAYDIVVSGQVIEHVRKTWRWIREVSRVCKPGGCVVTVNPVSWGYHEAPIDCWRIYPEGMKSLYDEADLEVEHCVAESLEPLSRRVSQYLKVFRKVLTGGTVAASGLPPVVDTITIGRKKAA
ncbi:MAG: methyltransferase domain-containing protein [Planctomycetaceae bacterium]|nr:methyltransferase domain-containing protein [Planctomycetaceae bacterium]MCB9953911.1 methyltransferase domain-containing protein [Planctomycetaceae bacterium]